MLAFANGVTGQKRVILIAILRARARVAGNGGR